MPSPKIKASSSPGAEHPQRRVYLTLDGLRGVAALAVVTRHAGGYFTHAPPESFLAVDLFFALSGFVIAHSYGERVEGGGFFRRFAAIRLIRLYPLFLLGITLGFFYRLGSAHVGSEGWTMQRLGIAALEAILIFGGGQLDNPTWTLTPELLANFAWAGFKPLRGVGIYVPIALGAVGVAAAAYLGTLDSGFNLATAWVGASRVGFSFFLGVVLYRFRSKRPKKATLMATACLAVLAVTLLLSPPTFLRPLFETGAVFVVFPALVFSGSAFEPGETMGRMFRFLGIASYAVYVLHQPLASLSARIVSRGLHVETSSFGLPVGLAFIGAVLLVSWLTDRYYDAPVRRWLSRSLLPRRTSHGTAMLR